MIDHGDGNKIFMFLNECSGFDARIDIDNMTITQVKFMLKEIKKLEKEIAIVKPILERIKKGER